ncbi:MAG TPA: hypothetical protein VMT67_09170 [Terriglobales bacterium]|nr:hypothetical protein [Terriglobales bacterium]
MRYKRQSFGRLILWIAGVCVLVCIAATALFAQGASKPNATASANAPEEHFYRNTTFGIRYKIPFGWVDRTKEMREQAAAKPDSEPMPETNAGSSPPANGDSSSSNPKASSRAHTAKNNSAKDSPSEVLLAIFERPPAAAGDTINSAVVIAAESAASYSGLKSAEDFLGPLTELATAQGFKSAGDPSGLTIDGREVVRADFSKQLTDKLAMHQSTLVLLTKGQIVTFTFIAGSDDEVDDLIENLGFVASRAR